MLIIYIFRSEVAAVAMGLEPEDGRFDGGWVGVGPRLGVLAVVGEVGAEFLKARFFGQVEIAEGDERLDAEEVGGIALGDAVGVGGDFRDLDGKAAAGGWSSGVVVREQEVAVVGDAIADELTNGGEQADVETKDGLIGLLGDGMLPGDDADAVVVNGATHVDTNDLFDGTP